VLLRLSEVHKGRVTMDGVDTSQVPLSTLRSKISIIPQDPFLFSTTIRDNLDPHEKYSDDDIWEILEGVQLADMVEQFPDKLLHPVTDKGENLSAGTRQLICIGRALLRRSKIVFMDEATANVDTSTDALIQQMMHQQFNDCTVLTIAHRLETVLGSDRVLVLDDGRVAEYDAPEVLMRQSDSLFRILLKKMHEQNKNKKNVRGFVTPATPQDSASSSSLQSSHSGERHDLVGPYLTTMI
jgi:ABC-type multidrug transport system fused ATPase/permease subunit